MSEVMPAPIDDTTAESKKEEESVAPVPPAAAAPKAMAAFGGPKTSTPKGLAAFASGKAGGKGNLASLMVAKKIAGKAKQRRDEEAEIAENRKQISMVVHDHHAHIAPYMIHPNSKWKRAWDIVTILAVLYLCWKIPFSLGIDWFQKSSAQGGFETFLDIWFAIDILVSFRTGFIHDGHLHMNPKDSADHYFEFWFWIDIFASIPFEVFGDIIKSKSARKSIKMVKWFKIPRLLRLGRMLKFLKGHAAYYRTFVAVFGFFLFIHLGACFYMSIAEPCAGLETDLLKGPCSQDGVGESYATAMHYGAVLMMGGSVRGLGDEKFDPENTSLMMWFSCMWMILGVLFTALVFAEVNTIVRNIEPHEWDFRVKQKRALAEASQHGLPHALQEQIKHYYDFLHMNNYYGGVCLLEDPDMSPSLKRQVSVELYKSKVAHAKIFDGINVEELEKLCEFIALWIVMPAEKIINKGDYPAYEDRELSMFIVSRGKCILYDPDDAEKEYDLQKNDSFGEASLIFPGSLRLATARAESICEIFCISKSHFDFMECEFIGFRKVINRIRKKGYKNLLGDAPPQANATKDFGWSSQFKNGQLGSAGGKGAAIVQSRIQSLEKTVSENAKKLDQILAKLS